MIYFLVQNNKKMINIEIGLPSLRRKISILACMENIYMVSQEF